MSSEVWKREALSRRRWAGQWLPCGQPLPSTCSRCPGVHKLSIRRIWGPYMRARGPLSGGPSVRIRHWLRRIPDDVAASRLGPTGSVLASGCEKTLPTRRWPMWRRFSGRISRSRWELRRPVTRGSMQKVWISGPGTCPSPGTWSPMQRVPFAEAASSCHTCPPSPR